jgi:hypothetical protein
MERGLQAAVRRFPLMGTKIGELARTDDGFRALCEDLADAESAMHEWAISASSRKEARQSEYRVLADELAAEIELILAA